MDLTGQTDQKIKKDIIDHLFWDHRVDASRVTVEVKAGSVTLSGTVPDYASRQAAESDVWSIPGTRSVENQITVETLVKGSVDKKIREDAEYALTKLAGVDQGKVDVSAVSGWVTFKGEVDSFWKKIQAEEMTSLVPHVKGITNELVVVPTENKKDQEIGEEIMKALDRNANVDVNSVHVEVKDGEVALSGRVPSVYSRWSALEVAHYNGGVVDVQDNLAVQG